MGVAGNCVASMGVAGVGVAGVGVAWLVAEAENCVIVITTASERLSLLLSLSTDN